MFNGRLVGAYINHTDTHLHKAYKLLKCEHTHSALPCYSTLTPPQPAYTHTHTHNPLNVTCSHREMQWFKTITGLSAAAQNKCQVACWRSLLLGLSLRAARASVVGITQGFSNDSIAKNTCTISALPCFILSLISAG